MFSVTFCRFPDTVTASNVHLVSSKVSSSNHNHNYIQLTIIPIMSRFNSDDNRYPPGFRSYSRQDDPDGRMYDDRSRSRSADRWRGSPGGTRSSSSLYGSTELFDRGNL